MLVLGIFCAELLVCVLMGISIVYALLIGLMLFVAYGKRRGFTWRELGGMIASGVKTARSVMTVLLMIGVLTGLWRACGTLPLIICYAVDLLRPETLLLTAFLLNCGISLLIGTSFGTAATMGSICMTVALSMGMDPAMVGGAILAGAYFGDRCSPVSTSALLVSELTKTDIYDNIRRMVRTAAVPFLLTCGIYGALGLCFSGSGETADLRQIFGRTAVLHVSALLPALLVLALAALRVKVKKAICASIAAALVLCVLLQRLPLWDILRFAVFGYTARALHAAGVRHHLRLLGLRRHFSKDRPAGPASGAGPPPESAGHALCRDALHGDADQPDRLQSDADHHADPSGLRRHDGQAGGRGHRTGGYRGGGGAAGAMVHCQRRGAGRRGRAGAQHPVRLLFVPAAAVVPAAQPAGGETEGLTRRRSFQSRRRRGGFENF